MQLSIFSVYYSNSPFYMNGCEWKVPIPHLSKQLAILLTTRDFVCCINTGAKIREFVKTRDFVPIEATGQP